MKMYNEVTPSAGRRSSNLANIEMEEMPSYIFKELNSVYMYIQINFQIFVNKLFYFTDNNHFNHFILYISYLFVIINKQFCHS